MAEPLKDSFGPDIPELIAGMLHDVEPGFDVESFLADCLLGFDDLGLTARARHISDRMAEHLPRDRSRAVDLIIEAMGPCADGATLQGMESFRYLPFVYFVADHGIDHFENSMTAQYELTKRFTAEFSIRTFIERYPDETLGRLRVWATDDNVHVRRLVSEGTRPRLPWAPRLKSFQEDPRPVIELLEILKDDPEEYVRRSVANNLNDISRDHPDLVVATAARWSIGASPQRRRLIRHALRTLIKHGHSGALSVIGYGGSSPVRVVTARITPLNVEIGARVRIDVDLENPAESAHEVLVDFIVHFVKANGSTSPKTFKGSAVTLAGGQRATVSKSVSLRQLSTRTHYPGVHLVEVQVNGSVSLAGSFELSG